MRKVSIDEVDTGAIAAADLLSNDGIVLLPRGVELSASMITRLRKMGVTELDVEIGAEERDAERAKQLSLLEERFAGCESNPFLEEMKIIVTDHLQAR